MVDIKLMSIEEESIRSSYTHKIGVGLPQSLIIATNIEPEDVLVTLRRYALSLGPEISYLDEDNMELYVNMMNVGYKHELLDARTSIRKYAWEEL